MYPNVPMRLIKNAKNSSLRDPSVYLPKLTINSFMSRTKKRFKSAECPNCHTVFADEQSNFCAHCGQENHTHKFARQTLRYGTFGVLYALRHQVRGNVQGPCF